MDLGFGFGIWIEIGGWVYRNIKGFEIDDDDEMKLNNSRADKTKKRDRRKEMVFAM
jgi:hypothetical protein